jgi:hypothetical protein
MSSGSRPECWWSSAIENSKPCWRKVRLQQARVSWTQSTSVPSTSNMTRRWATQRSTFPINGRFGARAPSFKAGNGRRGASVRGKMPEGKLPNDRLSDCVNKHLINRTASRPSCRCPNRRRSTRTGDRPDRPNCGEQCLLDGLPPDSKPVARQAPTVRSSFMSICASPDQPPAPTSRQSAYCSAKNLQDNRGTFRFEQQAALAAFDCASKRLPSQGCGLGALDRSCSTPGT